MKATLVLAAFILSVATGARAQVPEGLVKICFPKQHSDVLNYLVGVAKTRGFFEAEKLQVKIDILSYSFEDDKGPLGTFYAEMWEYAKGGKGRICHMGTLSAAAVMALPPERRDQLVPLFLSEFGSANDMDLVVGVKSKIKSVEDLKGKRIDVGSLPALLTLAKVLSSRGMKLQDVQVRLSNSDKRMLKGLNEGRYDAAFAMPLLSGMLETRRTVKVIEANVISKHMTTLPSLFFVANKGLVQNSPEGIQKFFRAIDKARNYLKEHPESLTMAAETLNNRAHAKRLRLTTEESDQAVKRVARGILDLRKNSEATVVRAHVKKYYQNLVDVHVLNGEYALDGWLSQGLSK